MGRLQPVERGIAVRVILTFARATQPSFGVMDIAWVVLAVGNLLVVVGVLHFVRMRRGRCPTPDHPIGTYRGVDLNRGMMLARGGLAHSSYGSPSENIYSALFGEQRQSSLIWVIRAPLFGSMIYLLLVSRRAGMMLLSPTRRGEEVGQNQSVQITIPRSVP
jgi:hypothetical protein